MDSELLPLAYPETMRSEEMQEKTEIELETK
jgi:hypothetical protein